MTDLFLAPHNDDEVLFGAFTLLRYRPRVVVVMRSEVQEKRGTWITGAMREQETACAMRVLGCVWEQWGFSDASPDWDSVRENLRFVVERFDFNRVFAPAIEESGNPQHNEVGALADEMFGGQVTHYMTYHDHRVKSEGVHVPYEPEWVLLKLKALACYESQAVYSATAHHFLCDMNEFYEA